MKYKMNKADVFTINNKYSHVSQQVFLTDKCISYD